MTPTATSWAPVLDGARRGDALAVARDAAVRVADPHRIRAAAAAAAEQSAYPITVRWEPHAVAQGDAGLALVCAHLDRCHPGEGWDGPARRYLAEAVSGAALTGAGPGLWSGMAGLAFVTTALARGDDRYDAVLEAIEGECLQGTDQLIGSLARRRPGDGVPVGEFDVISGLAGIGAHLLRRRDDPRVSRTLSALLAALVDLTEDTAGVPRWFTPAAFMPDELTARMHPHGHLNCGLAHGIPGPMAVMALALLDGVEVAGMEAAVARIAAWVASRRADDPWGVNWPTVVGLPEGSVPNEPSRAAWCYGSPGVARALWLAGRGLGDGELQGLAVEAMLAVGRRPVGVRRIDSPTCCHGVAGLLQITLRFAADTGLPAFVESAERLTDQLLAAYQPERLLGFCSLEPESNPVDQPGLLDGAPGVALTLLAAAGDVEPDWDRLFLLA